jgi:inner membrane protein
LDNVTHTLAGLVVADAAAEVRALLRERSLRSAGTSSGADLWHRDRFRGALFATSALANNGPDLDFIYTGITGGKLGYLLHHRGHTHTLVAAPLLAILSWAIVVLVLRLLGSRLDGARHRALLGVALFGSVLHIAMDYGNNYGVHPFWPVYSGWFYGDAVFIIEPWLTLSLSGAALGAATSRVLRGVLLLCVAGLLLLAWLSELAGVGLSSVLSVFAVAWCSAMWRASARPRLVSTFAALLGFGLILLVTRGQARASARAALAADGALLTLSSTPSPGNPLCWWTVAVVQTGDDYVVRQALAAPFESIFGVDRCGWPTQGTTAPLRAPEPIEAAAELPGVRRGRDFRAPLAELRELARDDCVARAFLRFARVPFWIRQHGRSSLIGDLRYDRSRTIDFAEIPLASDVPCPRFVPPWRPPLPLEP